MVIWKFTVPAINHKGESFIEIPDDSEIISVGIQSNDIVVWAIVHDTDPPYHFHKLIVVNTGTPFDLPPHARFLGTVTHSGGIVWHVFDGENA